MKLLNLKLINYRNIEYQELSLCEGINLFIGHNAQGKTNLLESIYFLARGKSFKNVNEKEIIRLGERSLYIGGNILRKKRKKLVEIKLSMVDKKRIRINKYELENIKELSDLFEVVMFSPEDLYLIKGSPYRRRTWLDDLITSIDSSYKIQLKRFEKALVQRNRRLKQTNNAWFDKEMDALDRILAETSYNVEFKRQMIFEIVCEKIYEIHRALSGNKEKLNLRYETNLPNIKKDSTKQNEWIADVEDFLLKKRKDDLDRGHTDLGPHRDDIFFNIDLKEARKFASQGQARTLALSMKLVELKILEDLKGIKPILLLDDVFSELDGQRAMFLLDSIKENQSLITSNEIPKLPGLVKGNVYMVKSGKFTPYVS